MPRSTEMTQERWLSLPGRTVALLHASQDGQLLPFPPLLALTGETPSSVSRALSFKAHLLPWSWEDPL